MDPHVSVPKGENGKDRKDHMSLVLLDEMNLARVEYYFSEFLSRLEVRPRYEDGLDDSKRRDALIPIDIRGLQETISLFPSHNVLFAGTMNDDESTQALSDKVLDRGNIMQFAAPRDFANQPIGQVVARPHEAQSFASWRTWVKSPDTLPRRVPGGRQGRDRSSWRTSWKVAAGRSVTAFATPFWLTSPVIPSAAMGHQT